MHTSNALFSSERLNFREISIADASWFFELNQDQDVIKFTGDTSFMSIAETKAFLEEYVKCYNKYGMGRWAISLKSTNEILGWCGLKKHSNSEVDLGFRIFKKHWNNGYATEAAKASINYGFKMLNIKSIHANHNNENKASKKVLEKLGFQREISFDENGKTWFRYSLIIHQRRYQSEL